MSDEGVDLIIIGAGPVGLFGAFYAGLRGLSTVLVDALDEPGGQVAALYPEKEILDVAGLVRVKGRELVAALVEQAQTFGAGFVMGEQVDQLTEVADHWQVTTATGRSLRGRAVLVTAGIGSFAPRRLPAAPDWTGAGMVHTLSDPSAQLGKQVVIVGGGDSAIDWAAMLAPIAARVTVVHRRDRFRAAPAMVERVKAAGVRFAVPAEVISVIGEDEVSAVEIKHGSGEVETLSCDLVVVALGFVADLSALREWGLVMKGRHVEVDGLGRTNLPRVYAAGDLTTREGKVELLATGFGDVATAVNNLAVELDPSVSLFPGHTTDLGW